MPEHVKRNGGSFQKEKKRARVSDFITSFCLVTSTEFIDMAAKFAKIEGDDYYKSIYPAKSDWTENILQKATGGGNYLDAQFKDVLGEYYEPFMLMKTIRQQSPVQARMMESFKIN